MLSHLGKFVSPTRVGKHASYFIADDPPAWSINISIPSGSQGICIFKGYTETSVDKAHVNGCVVADGTLK